jgi:hypothetical protein
LPVSAESFSHAPAREEPSWSALPPITGPQQYQVQFSTTEEHVLLIERAKALLARSAPGKSLGELHLDAMRLLVAALEKQRFAVTEQPRRTSSKAAASEKSSLGAPPAVPVGPVAPSAKLEIGEIDGESASDALGSVRVATTQSNESQNGRHIPAAVRRAVYARDGARCTYVDERGERCQETHYLELHHRQPFSMRGAHTAANLTLHCRAHNALAAELDFGRTHIAKRQESGRHASLALERRLVGEPD